MASHYVLPTSSVKGDTPEAALDREMALVERASRQLPQDALAALWASYMNRQDAVREAKGRAYVRRIEFAQEVND